MQYPDEPTAEQAKEYLDGHCMYPDNKNKVGARMGTPTYTLHVLQLRLCTHLLH